MYVNVTYGSCLELGNKYTVRNSKKKRFRDPLKYKSQ